MQQMSLREYIDAIEREGYPCVTTMVMTPC